MPRIPTYYAGQLASEQVGTPGQDTSGVRIAEAVTRVASKASQIAFDAVEKQHRLLSQAELSKQLSEFDSAMTIASEEVRGEYLTDPDEGVKQLDARRQEIFNEYKEGIVNADVKLAFDAAATESLAKGKALDNVWAFRERNKLIQKNHFDRFEKDAFFAGQTDNFEQVLDKAIGIENDSEGIYQAWGGVLEGSKAINAAQESMVKSYFYGQLSKGNAFKVLKEIDDGRLGPTDETGGLISPQDLKKMRNDALKMATAGKDKAAALALVDAVQTNFNIDETLKQPISTTEEQINELSFQIAKKQDAVTQGEVSQEEVDVLKQQQRVLQNVRAAQLSKGGMYIVPDSGTEAEMTARFMALFKGGEKLAQPSAAAKKPFKATLEEVFRFQQDLVENRDKIEPTLFKRLSRLVDKAFQSEIGGFVEESKFQTKEKFFGKELKPVDKGRLSGSKKLRNAFTEMVSQHDPEAGNKELFETMQFFFDDFEELLDIEDAPSLDAMTQEQVKFLIEGAKRKMQLKKAGLPIYLRAKDFVSVNGRTYQIVGYFPDGEPDVELVK